MNKDIKYRLVYDTMLTDWRYSHSPYHIVLFQHCLMNAFYKDTDDMVKGSFKTSVAKLSKASNISHSKIKMMLKDLSSGPNAELLIDTSTSQQYGYTKITVLNFDLYQLNPSNVKASHKKPNPQSSDNQPLVTTNLTPGHQVATKAGHQVATKEYEVLRLNNTIPNKPVGGSSFEDLIQVYPGKITNGAEAKAIFNNLSSTDKQKCVTFAIQLKNIWDRNGNEDNRKYIKGLYRYIDEKMFNGSPNEVLPKGVDTDLPVKPTDSRQDPEFIARFGELPKTKTMAEKALEKINITNN